MKAIGPYIHRFMRKPLLMIVVMAATFALATVTALMQKVAPPAKVAAREVAVAPEPPAIPKEETIPDGRTAIPAPNVINATTYAFTSASGASLEDMSSGTTMMVAPNQDDTASPLFDIGFEFWFDGTRQTQFSANANGLVRLGASVVGTTFSNDLASTTNVPQIAPYWDDTWLGTNGKVHYKVVGSAPNRKLVVEWLNMQVPRLGASLLTGAATFQAWLYEGTGVIEFVYGSGLVTNTANSGYSVGFGSSGTQFASVTTSAGTAAYGTANNTNTGPITSGTKYTFTPLVPTAPSGFNVTAITQAGMTLNWTDNSSNEVGFAIYRSDDGGTTYNFIQQAAANANTLAVTSLLPGVTYFWRVMAVSEGNVSAPTSGSAATTVAGAKTASTGNWNTAGTWTPSGVPATTDDVVIPDGVTVTLDTTGLGCNNLTIGGGASGTLQYASGTTGGLNVGGNLTINSGASFTAGTGTLTNHTLAVGGASGTVSSGSIINNGTFDMNTTASVAVTFTGSLNGTLSGSGSTFDFFSITVSKGTTSAPILDVTSVITIAPVSTSTTRLVITSGTFRLSSASNITPIGGTQTVVASAGRLWLNNAGAIYNSGSAGSPTVSGELRIDSGTFNYGSGNNTMTVSSTTGILTMNGGTLNMLGAVALTSSSGTQFIMSGGTINVDPQATNALATSTTLFSIGASTTVNWTGGTITIVDPHSAVGGTAWSAASGGAKLISGGTVNIGDGTSTTASGALANNTGFGISNTMGVWNLNINNRTDASNTRMARMTGSVTVFNQLSLQSNSYLFMGSSTTAATLFAQGNIVQGGTLAGTEPTGTQLIGTLQMQGFSGTQTVSGGGAYTNLPTLNLANMGTGVTLSNSSPLVVNRVNLFSGSINIGTMFTIGRPGTSTNPVVQIGGFSTTVAVPVGSFSALPTYDNTAGASSFLYSNTSTTLTTGAFNEMPAGAQTLGTFLLNDVDGITVDRQITASFLTLTAGIVNMSSNLMTVTNTATTAITGGSATAYVKGALARTLPASLVTGSTYTFPIGKSVYNLFEMVNPTTNAGGTVVVRAEVFDTDSGGTAGTGVDAISHNRYWQATITSGAANFTNTTVRLTEIPLSGTRIAQSATQAGTYNSIGGTVVGNTVLSTSTITSLDYFVLGFLAYPGGTYTVGTGGTYGTLTAALTDMNSKTLTGPVVFSLTDASYGAGETFPLVVNANAGSSATNTVTIKPASGVSPTVNGGASATCVINLNGADYVTIDGSNTAGGTTRDLTLVGGNTAASAVVCVTSLGAGTGATNNVVKNTNLVGAADTSTSTTDTFGIFSGGSGTPSTTLDGQDNDGNTFTNNAITKVRWGIYVRGGASNANDNNTISNNLIGSTALNTSRISKAGITVQHQNAIAVTGNEVRFVGILAADSGSGTDRAGIGVGDANWTPTTTVITNAVVTRNLIHDIVEEKTFSAVGIVLAPSGTSNTGNIVADNIIYNVRANGTSPDQGLGIGVAGGDADKVVYNSISMSGDIDPGTSTTATQSESGIRISSTSATNLTLKNNAISVDVSSNTATLKHYAIVAPSATYAWGTGGANNNDYFINAGNAQMAVGGIGTTVPYTDKVDLAAWQATFTPAQDGSSVSVNPQFVSATDLHLLAASTLLGAGTPITGVTGDFDSDPRPASNPDIGADEMVQAVAGMIAAGTYYNVTAADGDALSGNVTVTNMLTLNGKLSTGANTLALGCNATVSGAGASNYVIGNLKKTYCSAGSFNFVVGTANGFSPVTVNITAGTFPADFTVKAVQGPQPNLGTPSLALQRYWTLTGTGVTADLTFNYLDPTDIPGTANENNFVIFKYDGSFTQPGGSVNTAANTASITGVTSFSDWTLGEPGAPTDVALNAFTAAGLAAAPSAPQGGVVLQWQTGMEVANLGFNLYRDEAGQRVRINPNLIAGSAFFVGSRTVLGAGRSYVWRDLAGAKPAAQYWLEEVDINGRSAWHGPVVAVGKASADLYEPNARLINELNDEPNANTATRGVERFAPTKRVTAEAIVQQQALTKDGAIKIAVNREGWYQIKATDLVAAGLDPRSDSRFLQLFVDGAEQPINVVTNKDGGLAAIEFYGTGADNPYTSERAYWLAVGATLGKRITKVASAAGVTNGGSFIATVERRDRSLYFSALRNGEKENFFGAVIVRDPIDQSLTLTQVAARSASAAQLEVALQGVTNQAHTVRVELNGAPVGTLTFANQAASVARFSVAVSLLREGANMVRLTPLGGVSDVSLVDYLRVGYPHYTIAEGDALRFIASAKQAVTVEGFSKPSVRVLDVTDASAVQEVVGTVQAQGSGYAVSLLAPGAGMRTLIAVANDLPAPAGVALSASSAWRQPNNGADLVVITRKEFVAALDPLVALRKQQGLAVAVVDVEAIYNEFSFGQKTPQAIRDFLRYAATSWKKSPHYVLLAGDASFDPRNYLGAGSNDLVPTKLFDSQYLETATDDWFVDFNDDGVPELAIGRLPARTASEALIMASKIAGYDSQRSAETLLLVSDSNDTFNFVAASEQLRALIPGDLRVQSLHRGEADDAATRAALINAINSGQRLVNYVGHGSLDMWRGGVLGNDDVTSLTNSGQLTMFVMMTCLNGFYHDAAIDSLGERLLKWDRGGAVAVWASSGMTMPDAQAVMNQEAYRQLFNGQRLTIGEVMMRAKAATGSGDVRRTWILLGDPTTRLR